MGIFSMSGGTDVPRTIYVNTPGNPNPYNCKIIDKIVIGAACVVKIQYPDCTNYEGTKVLVYESHKDFLNLNAHDPHFLENHTSPVARFRPDDKGWALALALATILSSYSE